MLTISLLVRAIRACVDSCEKQEVKIVSTWEQHRVVLSGFMFVGLLILAAQVACPNPPDPNCTDNIGEGYLISSVRSKDNTFVITGSGFGCTATANTVTANGTACAILAAQSTSTQLVTLVPAAVQLSESVTIVAKRESYQDNWTGIPSRVITGMSVWVGPAGTHTSVYGINLGPNDSDNTVYFGGVPSAATVPAGKETLQVDTVVPAGLPDGLVEVYVDVNGERTNSLFFEVSGVKTYQLYSGGYWRTKSPLVKDVDVDGIKDLMLLSNSGQSIVIYLGRERGVFSEAPRLVDLREVGADYDVGDFNTDGVPDIVAVLCDGTANIALGMRNGEFEWTTPYPLSEEDMGLDIDVVLNDFNGDGQTDFGVKKLGSDVVHLFLGNGGGSFTESTFAINHEGTGLRLITGDWNHDSIGDLAIPCAGSLLLLMGEEDGQFSVGADVALPNGASVSSGESVDLNADGYTDIALLLNNQGQSYVLVGDGKGTFRGEYGPEVTYDTHTLLVADLDSNGMEDLVFSDYQGLQLWYSDGNGLSGRLQRHIQPGGCFAVQDISLDGRPDLECQSPDGHLVVLENDGNGSFPNIFHVGDLASVDHVEIGDVDLDGREDIVASGCSEIQVLSHVYDEGFVWARKQDVGSTIRFQSLGNFSGDSRPDLVIATETGPRESRIQLLLGSGDGTFDEGVSIDVNRVVALASGDVDLDGNRDVVFVTQVGEHPHLQVARGRSDGSLEAPAFRHRYSSSVARTMALGDLNTDGYLDVVVGHQDEVSVLLNLGDGTFGEEWSVHIGPLFHPRAPTSIAIGDLNDDGIENDVAVATEADDSVWVFLGHGDGTFANEIHYEVGEEPQKVVIGDFNGDGVSDLAVVNSDIIDNSGESDLVHGAGGSRSLSVLPGMGGGVFGKGNAVWIGLGTPVDAAIGDLTGDGQRNDLAICDLSGGGGGLRKLQFR